MHSTWDGIPVKFVYFDYIFCAYWMCSLRVLRCDRLSFSIKIDTIFFIFFALGFHVYPGRNKFSWELKFEFETCKIKIISWYPKVQKVNKCILKTPHTFKKCFLLMQCWLGKRHGINVKREAAHYYLQEKYFPFYRLIWLSWSAIFFYSHIVFLVDACHEW